MAEPDFWEDALPFPDDDDLFFGLGVPVLDDFQPMKIAAGGPDDESNTSRKRRGADPSGVEMPTKQVAAASMVPFFTYRPGGNGEPQTARVELVRLTQECKQLSQHVDQLRKVQFSALRDVQAAQLDQLKEAVPRVALQLKQARQATEVIPERYLLETLELFQVKFLLCQFGMLEAHALALNAELQWSHAGRPNNPDGSTPFFGSLFMHEYPECAMVQKGKPFPQTFVVEVITGVSTEVRFMGPMVASMAGLNCDLGNKTMLAGHEAPVDPTRKMARFSELRTAASTRMNPAVVSFTVPVSVNGGPRVTISSSAAPPCLVLTHESQWVDAETKLSVYNVFGTAKTASWQKFINTIHLRYLLLGKQDLKNPTRRLSVSDFHYVFNRFFGTAVVNVSQAEKFLAWFLPVMQQLRFKRHVLPLWLMGFIFGFIDKEQCKLSLTAFPEGSFLLRFSESSPGSFAIAYVSDDVHERVKHYLVTPEDIKDKSLADFIRGKPQWIHLVRVSQNGELSRAHKDDLLSKFYSNAHAPKKSGGYTLL